MLRDVIGKVIIVAYREDVSSLVLSLTREGFDVEVQRLEYTKEEMKYTSASRTLLSHRKAWQRAMDVTGYTLVCEADFIPCRGIGKFEVFWPLENAFAWGYLYQGSPRLLAILGSQRFLRSHASPTVCYVINNNVASLLLKFFEQEKNSLHTYFTFEAHLQWYVMGLGGEAFMPRCHYGEHGGSPNPEHASLGKISRKGQHRADNLMGSLHFMPGYANGKILLFLWVRLCARLMGIARLATGRWIMRTDAYHLGPIDVLRMYFVGLRRLLGPPN
jgi:hypothetical protein